MDDVYATALSDQEAAEGGSRPICVSNVDDRLFIKYLGDYAQVHVERMKKLSKVKVRVLIQEDDYYCFPDTDYIEYRWLHGKSTGDVPFYVYGDKLAILVFNANPCPQIVVVTSPLVSKAYRDQFDILWGNSRKRELRKQNSDTP
jgi:hypothetical protein